MNLTYDELVSLGLTETEKKQFFAASEYFNRALEIKYEPLIEHMRFVTYIQSKNGLSVFNELGFADIVNHYRIENDIQSYISYFDKFRKEIASNPNCEVKASFVEETLISLINVIIENTQKRFVTGNNPYYKRQNSFDTMLSPERMNFVEQECASIFCYDALFCIEELEKLYNFSFQPFSTNEEESGYKEKLALSISKIYAFLTTTVKQGQKIIDPLVIIKQETRRAEFEMLCQRWFEKCPNLVGSQILGKSVSNKKSEKSYVTYIVLAYVLGWLGIHNFYAGNKKRAIIQLILGITYIGAIVSGLWGFFDAYAAYKNKEIPNFER